MNWAIPIFKILWDNDDIEAVSRVVRRGMNWTIGPDVLEFENNIAKYIGRKYCVSFNSGTSALHAVLAAYGIGPGDEVIVPSFTFIATANAVLMVGATPVFADIEEKTFGLNPDDVENKITSCTKAIIPVHYAGNPCLIRELSQVADAHGLLLIEDAAEAFGARINNQFVGSFGDSAMLSFCQNKIITTGEGGAIVTDSTQIYEKLNLIRSHGRQDKGNHFASTETGEYVTLGYNFRLSEIEAALGISQMKKVESIIQSRRKNANYYAVALSDIPQISIPQSLDDYFHVYQMYTIRVTNAGYSRKELMTYLQGKGIMSKVYFDPVHSTRFYKTVFNNQNYNLPLTERISAQVLTLPMYPELVSKDIDIIAGHIRNFFN